jgi:hypothetical protein
MQLYDLEMGAPPTYQPPPLPSKAVIQIFPPVYQADEAPPPYDADQDTSKNDAERRIRRQEHRRQERQALISRMRDDEAWWLTLWRVLMVVVALTWVPYMLKNMTLPESLHWVPPTTILVLGLIWFWSFVFERIGLHPWREHLGH